MTLYMNYIFMNIYLYFDTTFYCFHVTKKCMVSKFSVKYTFQEVAQVLWSEFLKICWDCLKFINFKTFFGYIKSHLLKYKKDVFKRDFTRLHTHWLRVPIYKWNHGTLTVLFVMRVNARGPYNGCYKFLSTWWW